MVGADGDQGLSYEEVAGHFPPVSAVTTCVHGGSSPCAVLEMKRPTSEQTQKEA